jgi:proteasome accessory factor C
VSGPRNAEERLSRLLVMLPWLMEVGEVPLADVASRFDLSEAQVQQDLELVAMCGLPPFVDEMIDVFVDDGLVFVGVPRLFTRSLRLTAPEGFSLLASARAAMQLPGADPDGPLGRGLQKLAVALSDVGLGSDDDVDPDIAVGSAVDDAGVAIDLTRPDATDELVDAVADGSEVEISYYSPARDEVAERTIVPRHVFTDAGNWYVIADDGRSGERRTFRIDRIDELRRTGVKVAPDDVVAAPTGFFADADLPVATLRLAPRAQWVVERYPVAEVTPLSRPSGWVEARLPIASDRWLARLLIRLGPDVRLIEPVTAQVSAAELATRILGNY